MALARGSDREEATPCWPSGHSPRDVISLLDTDADAAGKARKPLETRNTSENLAGAGVKKDIVRNGTEMPFPGVLTSQTQSLDPFEIDGCGESHEGSSLNREFHLRT